MEEIKVGEYVRIKNGSIRKIIAINEMESKECLIQYQEQYIMKKLN